MTFAITDLELLKQAKKATLREPRDFRRDRRVWAIDTVAQTGKQAEMHAYRSLSFTDRGLTYD